MKCLLQRTPAGAMPLGMYLAVIAVILAYSVDATGQVSNSPPSSASHTQVVILGTGTPQADPDN